jgi:hypothetical protein
MRRGVLTEVLFCNYNMLMYNVSLIGFLVCIYVARFGQQARKKPLVTVILADPSYQRGWRYEYNYDQLSSFGQVILALRLYSIATYQLTGLRGERRWTYGVPSNQPTTPIKIVTFCLPVYGRLQLASNCWSVVCFSIGNGCQYGTGTLRELNDVGKPVNGPKVPCLASFVLLTGGSIRQKAKSQRNWRCPDSLAQNNFLLNRILLSFWVLPTPATPIKRSFIGEGVRLFRTPMRISSTKG